MATFVGAEYIIANILIALKKIGKRDEVTLDELKSAGIYIQNQSLSEDIDAIFLSSSEQLVSAIYDFSDYFEFNKENNAIKIVKTKDVSDLESRFMGYLPFKIINFIVDVSMEYAVQNCDS